MVVSASTQTDDRELKDGGSELRTEKAKFKAENPKRMENQHQSQLDFLRSRENTGKLRGDGNKILRFFAWVSGLETPS